MPIFNLPVEATERLKMKFNEFQKARREVHDLLVDYAADYSQFKGNTLERQESLRRKYSKRAPDLNHLVWDSEGEVYWNAPDIAIVMGRNQSSIARTLLSMERDEGWRVRLLALRKSSKAANGLLVFAYHQDIFDLIIDRYEEEYLRRFSEPRRGDKENAPDIEEVRRFWNYLKARAQAQQEGFIHQEEDTEPGNLPPLKWREVLSLIWNKVFTVKTGTITSVVFAVCFEVTRRWPFIAPWLELASALILLICAASLRFRKTIVFTLSDLGAVALLFTLLWTAGLLSPDGIIRSPGGAIFSLHEAEEKIEVTPILQSNSGQVNFHVTGTPHGAKELLYRFSPSEEYRSTGLTAYSPYPNPIIDNPQLYGTVNLDVKYIDKSDHEHGPWSFSFDINKERVNLNKRVILSIKEPWVETYRLTYNGAAARTFVMLHPIIGFPHGNDTVSAVVYGLNTDEPDRTLTHEDIMNLEEAPQILSRESDDIRYVTSYLIFKDGTSSDIRYSKLLYK